MVFHSEMFDSNPKHSGPLNLDSVDFGIQRILILRVFSSKRIRFGIAMNFNSNGDVRILNDNKCGLFLFCHSMPCPAAKTFNFSLAHSVWIYDENYDAFRLLINSNALKWPFRAGRCHFKRCISPKWSLFEFDPSSAHQRLNLSSISFCAICVFELPSFGCHKSCIGLRLGTFWRFMSWEQS